jgi:hypothetical protein
MKEGERGGRGRGREGEKEEKRRKKTRCIRPVRLRVCVNTKKGHIIKPTCM